MEASEAAVSATRDDQPRLFGPDPGGQDIYALIDDGWRVVAVSDRTRELLGCDVDAAIGEAALANVHPADLDRATALLMEVAEQPGVTHHLHVRARPGAGPWHDFDLRVTNLLHEPAVGRIVVEGDDVTEQSRALIATHLQAQVLERLPVAVVVTDRLAVIAYWNGQAEALFGLSAEDALGRTMDDLGMAGPPALAGEVAQAVHDTGRWEGEREVRRPDGEVRPVLVTVETIDVPELGFSGVISASIDNTERRALQDELSHRALHDPLTGLPNRALFRDRLDHALQQLQREAGMVAVLFVDLDRFKIINDTSGHEAGDEVLRAVAALFESVVRPGDTVARLGGDEFAVCCEHLHDVGEAMVVAERLTAAVSQPFVVDGREFYVSPSIGIVVGTGAKGESASTLLRDADAAMYAAKDKGRGRVEVFDRAMRSDIVRRAEVASELRRALHPPQFRLHYQPLVGLADGQLRGFEALVRWEHPERGLLDPGEFIDIAEETNLIVPIGRWVLEESARQLARWRDELPEHPITISVNLSARQIADPALVPTVRDVLSGQHLDPSALCLEITESVLMEDAAASVATLRNLKAIGVQLAIDDFGTGYSSLAYLKRFPVDHLKVDRSFVHGIGRESEDSVIVKAVIELGAALGLAVVAEGVETVEQLDELRRLGCDGGQGYLWSVPLPGEDVVHLAREWRHAGSALPHFGPSGALGDEPPELSTGELLRVLTHELATPLTVVRGQSERLLGALRDVPAVEPMLQSVVRNAERIDRLVSSLSDAQQLEAGALALRVAPFDLVALVRDVVPTVLPEDREVHLEVPEEAVVDADGARVEQILVNLLTNAEKFSPPGTPIVVRVEEGEGEVAVVVLDEGPGVPPERVADIFRKFGRLERAKKGVGLGLFLSRRLARAHGGELRYRRHHPAGSELVLTLPRQPANR